MTLYNYNDVVVVVHTNLKIFAMIKSGYFYLELLAGVCRTFVLDEKIVNIQSVLINFASILLVFPQLNIFAGLLLLFSVLISFMLIYYFIFLWF